MRSITAALVGIALAAGAAYAHGNRTEASGQGAGHVAGTLTCLTKPELSLVFGRNPVADCTFVAERGGARQAYQALLPATASAAEVESVQRIVWRVRTPDGASRPALLRGAFLSGAAHTDREPRTLTGRFADLEIVSHSRRSVGAFARSQARLDLAPIEDDREG